MPFTDNDRDLMIRTILGEASNQPPEGQAAVAHVILNRAKVGKYGGRTPSEVVLAPGQFEPWQTRAQELQAINPNSKAYKNVAKIVDGVVGGNIPDPTNGASHFLQEEIVRQRRGGTLPNWARGDGLKIGGHTFYYPDAAMAPAQNRTLPMQLGREPQAGPTDALAAINQGLGLSATNPNIPPLAMRYAADGAAPPAPTMATQRMAASSANPSSSLLDLWDAPAAPQATAPAQKAAPSVNLLDLWDTPEAAPVAPPVQAPTTPAPVMQANPNKPGMIAGTVRSIAEGIPIIGALPNKGNALIQAGVAPIMPGDQTISQAPTFGQRYSENLKREQGMSQSFEQEHPIVSTGAGLAGGIAATLPVAATGIGAKLLGLVGKNIPQRMAAGAASGGAIGGVDSAMRGNDFDTGALVGAGFGAAAPAAGRVVGAGYEKLKGIVAPRIPLPSTEAIGDAAEAGYNMIRNMDVQIRPEAVKSLAIGVKKGLVDDGVRDFLAPKTFGVLSELETATQAGNFADLHGIRRAFGKAASSPDPTERMAATRAISALDGYLTKIPKSDVIKGDADAASKIFNKAQADYGAMKRSELLAGKIEQAELQAASANSGANIDNATRQRIKDILKSPKLSRGFNENELSEMQKIVRGTAPGNMLRHVGNWLGGGGGLGMLASQIGGGLTGYAAGGHGLAAAGAVAAPAVGYLAKKAGNKLTERGVTRLDEMIRARAPASENAVLSRALAEILQQQRIGRAQDFASIAGRNPALSGIVADRDAR